MKFARACIMPVALFLFSAALPLTASARGFGPSVFEGQGGKAIYESVCQNCHMPDGKGAIGAGAYPALAENQKLAELGYPVSVVINGSKSMPAFGPMFSDQQIADVVNFIRTHFGNNYRGSVTTQQVKAAR